jgi:hypothetical protein
MYKRPTPRRVFAVDTSTLTFAPIENSIVYKLRHVTPYPAFQPPPYVPVWRTEDLVFGLRREGASEEEIEHIRKKNYYVAPAPKTVKKTKKKKVLVDDLDKVFSQFSTKLPVKKKVLKAVVKKI